MDWQFALALTAAALLALVGALALAVKRAAAARYLVPRRTIRDTPSAALPPEEARILMEQARQAAARHARGEAVANPCPKGTRAYVLWETQFHCSLMDFTPQAEQARRG